MMDEPLAAKGMRNVAEAKISVQPRHYAGTA